MLKYILLSVALIGLVFIWGIPAVVGLLRPHLEAPIEKTKRT